MSRRSVVAAHRAWMETRQQSGLRRAALVAAIEDVLAQGATQSEIARWLGWPRQRIGKLLGK